MRPADLAARLTQEAFRGRLAALYGPENAAAQAARYTKAAEQFEALFGRDREAAVFSAPGRTEIGGNHTDHQHGCVLAAAVNLDAIAVAAPNGDRLVRIKSEGYPAEEISLASAEALAPHPEEQGRFSALVRGILARFLELGYAAGGFDAYLTSDVLPGSGLSSSAAVEVLLGTIVNHLYNSASISSSVIAQIAQYAENNYFGKPCGLMDQTSSAAGGFVFIDFLQPHAPVIERLPYRLAQSGHALCIVNTGGNHADLTDDYAAVPREMRETAARFGRQCLREVAEEDFYARLPALRGAVSDRAILRAMHFFDENRRAQQQAEALRTGNFTRFLELVTASGHSSCNKLQNVYAPHSPGEQGLSLALALCERVLAGQGAYRLHGGGFAGTVQAFVPTALLDGFRAELERVFGRHSCLTLSVRAEGGLRVFGPA